MAEGQGAEEGSAEVSLVVKSPAQRHPDLLLSARRTWSVRRLKTELRSRHPDQPVTDGTILCLSTQMEVPLFQWDLLPVDVFLAKNTMFISGHHLLGDITSGPLQPEDCQRLIYSGKLLHDHLCLEQVFAKQEVTHAVHLVCNSNNVPETDRKAAEAKQGGALSQHPSVLSSVCALSQRERSCNQPSTTTEATNGSQLQPPFQGLDSGYSSYTMYHLLQLWCQQIYARQYYMQYMAARAAPSDPSSTRSTQDIPVAPVAAPAPIPGPFPADNQPGNQNAPPQVNPGVNQNLQMNAQGGPLMEEDEEVNRDWLDWLYSATLFYVFINIVYFYSSMSRLLMVVVGTLLIYLHQGRWFPFRRRQVQPAQPAENNVPPQEAINQDQNNNLPEENIGDPGEEEASEVVPETRPAAPSFMSIAWLFVKAFFASLLPEGPPAVAN